MYSSRIPVFMFFGFGVVFICIIEQGLKLSSAEETVPTP